MTRPQSNKQASHDETEKESSYAFTYDTETIEENYAELAAMLYAIIKAEKDREYKNGC